MGNPVVHWELMSKQPQKVAEFYAKIFGWKVDHRPEFNYRIVETGGQGGINGGIVKPDKPEPHDGPMEGKERLRKLTVPLLTAKRMLEL